MVAVADMREIDELPLPVQQANRPRAEISDEKMNAA
jgi:hypothetical protein